MPGISLWTSERAEAWVEVNDESEYFEYIVSYST